MTAHEFARRQLQRFGHPLPVFQREVDIAELSVRNAALARALTLKLNALVPPFFFLLRHEDDHKAAKRVRNKKAQVDKPSTQVPYLTI